MEAACCLKAGFGYVPFNKVVFSHKFLYVCESICVCVKFVNSCVKPACVKCPEVN